MPGCWPGARAGDWGCGFWSGGGGGGRETRAALGRLQRGAGVRMELVGD